MSGYCKYFDPVTQNQRKEKGKIHICSKSIIFEADDHQIPLYKILFKNLKERPNKSLPERNTATSSQQLKQELFTKKVSAQGQESIQVLVNRLVEINTNGSPQPYLIHDYIQTIQFIPQYENINTTLEWIQLLFDTQKTVKPGFDPDIEINRLIMENHINKKNFDMSNIESVSEKSLMRNSIIVRRVLPLNIIYGFFFMTDKQIYFQSFHQVQAKPVKKIKIDEIQQLYKGRFELQQLSLEIIIQSGKSYFFAFENTMQRNEVYKILIKKVNIECLSETSLDKITHMWMNNQISNFDYIMHLNRAAYRTFADLTQYPVFPWILNDFSNPTIDLNDSKIYRDLSKPIGALNQKRLQDFIDRFNEMPNPKFHYGTHYSTPGYVIGYLVRKKPQFMIKFQGGKFDKSDRLFYSIKKDWENVTNNPGNVKELIPEFYGEDDSFLVNKLKLNLGLRQNEKKVDNVKLPKWAKSAQHFLEINKKALESEYVSHNLHNWIDLIFGYKQRGPAAVEAFNVFHHLTYEGSVDLDSIQDPIERKAMKVQINEFGQTPKQLFKINHPPKYSIQRMKNIPKSLEDNITNFKQLTQQNHRQQQSEILEQSKQIKKEEAQNTGYEQNLISMMLKRSKENEESQQTVIQNTIMQKTHKNAITSCSFLPNSESKILTTGTDGFIKVLSITDKFVNKSFKVCDFCISCQENIDEDLYILGSWDNSLYIYNLSYGNKVDQFEDAHHDSISTIKYLHKQKIVVSGSWDCTLKATKLQNNKFYNKYGDETLYENECQISHLVADDTQENIIFGDIEGSIKILDLNTQQIVNEYQIQSQGNTDKILKVHFTQNQLILGSSESKIQLFDLNNTKITSFYMKPQNGNITDVTSYGNQIIVCTDKGHVEIYDLLLDKSVGTFLCNYDVNGNQDLIPSGEYQFSCLSFDKSFKNLVFGCKDGSINCFYI